MLLNARPLEAFHALSPRSETTLRYSWHSILAQLGFDKGSDLKSFLRRVPPGVCAMWRAVVFIGLMLAVSQVTRVSTALNPITT
jgi:hypothetical protein